MAEVETAVWRGGRTIIYPFPGPPTYIHALTGLLPISLFASASLTHSAVPPPRQFGAEIGVGMCESVAHGTNWQLFAKTFTAWCFTVFISGAFSAFFFAAGRQRVYRGREDRGREGQRGGAVVGRGRHGPHLRRILCLLLCSRQDGQERERGGAWHSRRAAQITS